MRSPGDPAKPRDRKNSEIRFRDLSMQRGTSILCSARTRTDKRINRRRLKALRSFPLELTRPVSSRIIRRWRNDHVWVARYLSFVVPDDDAEVIPALGTGSSEVYSTSFRLTLLIKVQLDTKWHGSTTV